jgi:hypothetical protein
MSQSKFSSLRVALVAAVVFALFGAGSRLEATIVLPMNAAELSDQAELVFTGTAMQTRVVRSQDGNPYTFVTFTVRDVLKGWTMDRQIALRFAGGEIADGVASLEGMPQFEQGETYLLFVHGNGKLLCPVLGWWQGQYRFTRQTGSGKQLLVDSTGVALSGVEKGRFQRIERGARRAEAEMTVLSEEGVHVEVAERTPRVSVTAEAPDAAQVVEQLRSFIAGRASAATFRPGKRVASARPEGLPARQQ